MERITESSKATIDHFGNKITFINVMRNMSVDYDCAGIKAFSDVTNDDGFLAKKDILSLDQSCVDIVFTLGEEHNNALVERMISIHGGRPLNNMKELGMGNDRYRLY